MKLIDIARNIDKSPQNEFDVDFDVFSNDLNLNCYGWYEQDRLKGYWLGDWCCTDTAVGSRLYFFDDEPVAYSFQSGRKNDENLYWFSEEAAQKVRGFILSLEELHIRVCDVNEDIGDSYKIEFNTQVMDWSMARYNGQPIEFIERIRETPDYGIDTKSKIRVLSTGEELVVDIKDLDFLYHFSDSVKTVDEVLKTATVRSAETEHSGEAKGPEFVME